MWTSAVSSSHNYNSPSRHPKSSRIPAPPCAFTGHVEEQIRVEGPVSRISKEESDEYLAGRPRGSQIGAWASEQSAELPSADALDARTRAVEEQFAGQPVPRPPHWGGLRVTPERMEFWYGRTSRLHERFLYIRSGDAWQMSRLYP